MLSIELSSDYMDLFGGGPMEFQEAKHQRVLQQHDNSDS